MARIPSLSSQVHSHIMPLQFIDPSAIDSAVVVTTRIRSLIGGAEEVQCGTLSTEASLELLLGVGGFDHLISNPPLAAIQAVDLCGCLPLALSLAGGIITELADTWQDELIPLLKEEFEDSSVEERMVTASLRVVPESMRAGVEGLFACFACFAEDAIVPAAAIDIFAPLMPASLGISSASATQQKRQMRKWLQQLIKGNILRGSIDTGISVQYGDVTRTRPRGEGPAGHSVLTACRRLPTVAVI